MKKIIAIILLIRFSVQITGVPLFFHIRQASIKKTVKKRLRRRMDTESLEQFVFYTADKTEKPEWEGDDEFRYKGEMYDVVEKRVEQGKTIIVCINDKKEALLVKQYKKAINDDIGGNSKKRSSILLKLLTSFYSPVALSDYNKFVKHSKQTWYTLVSPLFSTCGDVLTPPPQFT